MIKNQYQAILTLWFYGTVVNFKREFYLNTGTKLIGEHWVVKLVL